MGNDFFDSGFRARHAGVAFEASQHTGEALMAWQDGWQEADIDMADLAGFDAENPEDFE